MQAIIGATIGATIGFIIGIMLITVAINHNCITDVKHAKVLVAHGCGSYDKEGEFSLFETKGKSND